MLHEAPRTAFFRRLFVVDNEQRRVASEEAVDVFQSAARGLGIKKVDYSASSHRTKEAAAETEKVPVGIKAKLNTVQIT